MKKIDRLLDAYDVAHFASLEGGIDFETFIVRFCTDLDKKKDEDVFKAARRWRKLLRELTQHGAVFDGANWGYGGFAFNADDVKKNIGAALDELSLNDT